MNAADQSTVPLLRLALWNVCVPVCVTVCIPVCMYLWASHIVDWASTSWLAEQGKIFCLCPSSRLRVWSPETGLVFPSRVSPLIIHTQAEYGAYLRDSSRFPRRRPSILCDTDSVEDKMYVGMYL